MVSTDRDIIAQVRHDLRTLGSLLNALRTGMKQIDNLDPDLRMLCDGAVGRLETIIARCHPADGE